MSITPQEALDTVNSVFGSHPGHRALHAKGLVATGTFTPTAEGAELTKAVIFHSGPVPATVRFSNGAGHPGHGDFLPDPRGLAVKLTLPDGVRTDIVAVSSPYLPTRTPEEFIGLIKAQGSGPRPGLGMLLFLATHPGIVRKLPGLAPTLAPRASLAGLAYYGIHAFRWFDANGTGRFVRYTWEPAFAAAKVAAKEAKAKGPDYLFHDLRARLASDQPPITFTLMVTLAEPGDPIDDPSAAWPKGRRRVNAGTLAVDGLDFTRERDGDVLVFDPTRVIDGIELSGDPVLRFRSAAYGESVRRRMTES